MTEHRVEAGLEQLPPNGNVLREAQRGGDGGGEIGRKNTL